MTNVFSHVSLILVATFSIFAKSLLTNFLALVYVHAPPCFWNRTRGFLEVRRLWEPGSSITTVEFSLFQILQKVSAVNVRWTEQDSYLSSSQKSSS